MTTAPPLGAAAPQEERVEVTTTSGVATVSDAPYATTTADPCTYDPNETLIDEQNLADYFDQVPGYRLASTVSSSSALHIHYRMNMSCFKISYFFFLKIIYLYDGILLHYIYLLVAAGRMFSSRLHPFTGTRSHTSVFHLYHKAAHASLIKCMRSKTTFIPPNHPRTFKIPLITWMLHRCARCRSFSARYRGQASPSAQQPAWDCGTALRLSTESLLESAREHQSRRNS